MAPLPPEGMKVENDEDVLKFIYATVGGFETPFKQTLDYIAPDHLNAHISECTVDNPEKVSMLKMFRIGFLWSELPIEPDKNALSAAISTKNPETVKIVIDTILSARKLVSQNVSEVPRKFRVTWVARNAKLGNKLLDYNSDPLLEAARTGNKSILKLVKHFLEKLSVDISLIDLINPTSRKDTTLLITIWNLLTTFNKKKEDLETFRARVMKHRDELQRIFVKCVESNNTEMIDAILSIMRQRKIIGDLFKIFKERTTENSPALINAILPTLEEHGYITTKFADDLFDIFNKRTTENNPTLINAILPTLEKHGYITTKIWSSAEWRKQCGDKSFSKIDACLNTLYKYSNTIYSKLDTLSELIEECANHTSEKPVNQLRAQVLDVLKILFDTEEESVVHEKLALRKEYKSIHSYYIPWNRPITAVDPVGCKTKSDFAARLLMKAQTNMRQGRVVALTEEYRIYDLENNLIFFNEAEKEARRVFISNGQLMQIKYPPDRHGDTQFVIAPFSTVNMNGHEEPAQCLAVVTVEGDIYQGITINGVEHHSNLNGGKPGMFSGTLASNNKGELIDNPSSISNCSGHMPSGYHHLLQLFSFFRKANLIGKSPLKVDIWSGNSLFASHVIESIRSTSEMNTLYPNFK